MSTAPTDHLPRASDDELVARYHEAVALDGAAPGPELRAAVLAQAEALNHDDSAINKVAALAHQAGVEAEFCSELPLPPSAAAEAANDRRWLIPAAASVAVLSLAGLLALQFERGPADEPAIALGQRAPVATADPAPAPPAVPVPPAVAPAPVAAQTAPAAPRADTPPRPRRPAVVAEPAATPAPAAPAPAATLAAPGDRAAPAYRISPSGRAALSSDARRADQASSAEQADAAPAPAALTPGQRLRLAVMDQRLADARAALADGAALDDTDARGRTPLMLAAARGDAPMAQLLLQAGADARRADRQGLSAADHARRAGHAALAHTLAAAAAAAGAAAAGAGASQVP